ncbi:hypothetical protein DKT77_04290 [Meridianimarinicoccus roseus]|uniref:VPLPA-CTERM sorting domain-containing protein n=1 Tax=Meridianimarinicoccus roseus TaxID=2072018 RepID=A0A2V2LL56_9RHOB|nr:hypothetical protein [Meridianimarinicoccus roseus]PWR03936.1 hypothetical protein DKT77_04290 [Meridianimarinicoccus roseus]
MIRNLLTLATLLGAVAPAGATTFTDRATFTAALDPGYTLIDTSTFIGQTTADISAATPGATFFGALSSVRSDDLILNGAGFFGSATPHVGLTFSDPVNGVGVQTNPVDGGRILIYSGPDGSGSLLGSAGFGPSLVFGGITTTAAIGSVVFTCDFNFDLRCGLRDIVFGAVTSDAPQPGTVPLPAGIFLLGSTIGLLGASRARRHTR